MDPRWDYEETNNTKGPHVTDKGLGVDRSRHPATGDWDRQLIEDVFWEEDWERILSIPIK